MDILFSQGECGPDALVQSHGWMLVCDRNGLFVRGRSAHIGDIFPEATGRQKSLSGNLPKNLALADVVGAEAAHALGNASAKAAHCPRPILLPRLATGNGVFDVAVFIAGEEIVIEFEPANLDLPQSPLDFARGMMDRIASLDEPEKLLSRSAQLLAAGLRFGRVMVARVEEKSATVVAANKPAPGPTTAAALWRLLQGLPSGCRSRAIRDVDAASTRLVLLSASATDLSFAGLRGASPEERHALRDLGAASCLLLPIFDHRETWGVFVCLDPAAWPSMESRAVAELFAEFLSLRLEAAFRRKQPPALQLKFTAQNTSAPAPDAGKTGRNAPLSILIVEDEWLIAQELESSLIDHGADVTDICASVEQALESLEKAPPDAAVLDLMLRGKTSAPVAAALRQKGVPFIFATGYGDRSDLPDEFADVPMVGKPYDGETVLDALTAALARPRQAARPGIGDADPFLES